MAIAIVLAQPLNAASRRLAEELAAPLGGFLHLDDIAPADRDAALARARVVMAFKPLRELGDALGRLGPGQLLQIVSAGLDDLPFDDLPPGLVVAGNSGAFARPMAEHALAMILCLAKRLREEDAAMRRGEFNQMAPNLLLAGKKAAVLGLGGAGKAVARLLAALGMEVFALNTSGKTDEPVAFVGTRDALDAILTDAQVAVLTLPYTRLTHELIGARELALLRPDAILVNVARGEILSQGASTRICARTPHSGPAWNPGGWSPCATAASNWPSPSSTCRTSWPAPTIRSTCPNGNACAWKALSPTRAASCAARRSRASCARSCTASEAQRPPSRHGAKHACAHALRRCGGGCLVAGQGLAAAQGA
ncbi:NAD(P)-dependent oxidoreductase [Solidesulfovibrio alcoholivorans]|uniref:NAD(P)-dependent oxidoreductase n=1 Tax=Solidesulfovibrio alcoholivorans TaxID=81406 RepID=UPI000693E453|nr:NAD(P)-dependent oxidoreductase [Solidesulfovibrio alcoholivorans]